MNAQGKLENFLKQDDQFKQVLDELFANYWLHLDGELPYERREKFVVFYLAVNDLLDEGWRGE